MSARLYPFGRNGGQRVDTARTFLPTTTSEQLDIPPPLVHTRTLAARRPVVVPIQRPPQPKRPSLAFVALVVAVVGFLMLLGVIR